jgi:hypothetical protein
MSKDITANVYQDMNYFVSLGIKYSEYLMYEKKVAFYTLDEIRRMANLYKQPELEQEMNVKLQEFATLLSIGL